MASFAARARQNDDRMHLLARASVARRLVKEHQLDGPLALSLAVEPTLRMQSLEARVNASTLMGRALGRRANQ